MKETDLWNMFKTASKNVCISVIVVSPDPLSPTPSTSVAMKTQNRFLMALNQQLEIM
jgi:hypothetical protein